MEDNGEFNHPKIANQLKSLILEDPNGAWVLLEENPSAVVALSNVRRDIEKNHSSDENVQIFLNEYERRVKKLFNLQSQVDRQGLALTTELLTEVWRRQQQQITMRSLNEILLNNLVDFNEEIETMEESPNTTILNQMVKFGMNRIVDFEGYEKDKATSHWAYLKPSFERVIETEFSEIPEDKLPETWEAWFSFASSSIISAEVYRDKIAELILDKLKPIFESCSDQLKYNLAPWILSFEKSTEDKSE